MQGLWVAVSHETNIPSLAANSHLESASEPYVPRNQLAIQSVITGLILLLETKRTPAGEGIVASVLEFLSIGSFQLFLFSFEKRRQTKVFCYSLYLSEPDDPPHLKR
jgi:hypothetical protein